MAAVNLNLKTTYELDSDEPNLETDQHREQIDLLIRLLKFWWSDRQDFYISGNLTVYYNQQQLKSRDFRGPDIFVVMGVERKDRRSWVVWEEGGMFPNLVIELLSSSTAAVDRGLKKQLYQDVWQVANYFWFDPYTLEFVGFKLVCGKYEAIAPTTEGYLWSDQLELFLGTEGEQLRWFSPDRQIVPLPEERERLAREWERLAKERERSAKEQERLEKDQERSAKEQALKKVAQLEQLLRDRGIEPS